MAQWHLGSGRKTTGGLLKRGSKKKKYQRGRDFVPAHIGATKRRKLRKRGGNEKTMLLSVGEANIAVHGIVKKVKITGVESNPADSQFVRRNIVTKGAVIETEMGKARVTSRPGQDGIVNAVLVEEKKE